MMCARHCLSQISIWRVCRLSNDRELVQITHRVVLVVQLSRSLHENRKDARGLTDTMCFLSRGLH